LPETKLDARSAPAVRSPGMTRINDPTPMAAKPKPESAVTAKVPKLQSVEAGDRPERRVPMTRLRARVAERLVEAQRTAAILTTFNEVNMQPVMELRARHRERFEQEHGVRLGFMSFFVKAAIEALRHFPEVNASIDDHDIVYHGFYDIGIAVGTPRGLVVPVLRDADRFTMAEIESRIRDFGERAQNGRLTLEEITGGTFTITNGGVFGSLLSTPILNPPQAAILGMHKIQERPVAEKGQVVVRPIMYLALSYDHRLIDGREAVQFLVMIKELLEDPARLLLEV
jgi:2-oxoglutarate dehydrogenase E2 component (dihydrolipoamide succinyltransferase)